MTEILFKNAANFVTLVRIILTFWLNGLIWFNSETSFSLIFFLAVIIGITDWLDGWIARRWKIVSPLGGDLDKFADKLYAISIFIYFIKREIINWDFNHVLLIFVGSLIMLILCIEFVLIVIWIIGFFRQLETKSHIYGKIKMAIQFIAIGYWFLIEWIGSLV
ncbi:CDP-alcohol phosphatidyltransferase family protein, partial [Patescibacteria group bacterium]|nr:CDP-alcohol phosphatidyltransferase family protein [Patescibacteria group bacterium]